MKQMKNEKGFSMIELIVVVAIMAIIGAVLIPQFGTMSARARMTSDASTVKAVQQQIDVYIADIGTTPGGAAFADGTNINDGTIIEQLINEHYLDNKYLSNGDIILQSNNATCTYDATAGHFMVNVSDEEYGKLRANDPNKDVWIKSN